VGLAIGAAAAISGLGYSTDVLHMPLVIGLSVTFGCLVLAVLGRPEPAARADYGLAALDERR